jgi:hypothetical protein
MVGGHAVNWIRVSAAIGSDPEFATMARTIGVTKNELIGAFVRILCELSVHARDGDLSRFDRNVVEDWCDWKGGRGRKAGVFAAEFFARFCTPQGVVKSWDKYNGAAMRESESSKERARAWRENKKARTENERVRNGERTENERVANGKRTPLRDGTGHNGTTLTTQISLLSTDPANAKGAARPRAAAKPKAAPKWPHWPEEERRRMHATWTEKLGHAEYKAWVAQVGAELAGVRATVTNGTVERAWRSVVDYVAMGGRETPFLSDKPARVAKRTVMAVKAFQETSDPEQLARRLELIVHGREVA